jgi:hypothetical protein
MNLDFTPHSPAVALRACAERRMSAPRRGVAATLRGIVTPH